MSAPEQSDADTSAVETQPDAETEGDGEGKQGMRRSSKIAIVVIVLIAVAAGIAFGANYLINSSHYVTTDNAQIDGTQIPIVAPTSGTLVGWTGNQGAVLRPDQVVGRVEIDGGYVRPQRSIRAPAAARPHGKTSSPPARRATCARAT